MPWRIALAKACRRITHMLRFGIFVAIIITCKIVHVITTPAYTIRTYT